MGERSHTPSSPKSLSSDIEYGRSYRERYYVSILVHDTNDWTKNQEQYYKKTHVYQPFLTTRSLPYFPHPKIRW